MQASEVKEPERGPSDVPPCLSSSRGKRLWSHSAAITSDLMAKRFLRVSLLQPDIKPECLIAAFVGRKLSCRIFWLVFIYLRQLNGFPLTTHTRTYGRKSTYMTPLTSLCACPRQLIRTGKFCDVTDSTRSPCTPSFMRCHFKMLMFHLLQTISVFRASSVYVAVRGLRVLLHVADFTVHLVI